MSSVHVLSKALNRNYTQDQEHKDCAPPNVSGDSRFWQVARAVIVAMQGDLDSGQQMLKQIVQSILGASAVVVDLKETEFGLQTLLSYSRIASCRLNFLSGSNSLSHDCLAEAELLATKVGLDNPVLQARLQQCAAGELSYEGKHSEAVSKLNEAYRLIESLNMGFPAYEVELLVDIAQVYFRQQSFNHAREAVERAIERELNGYADKLRLARALSLNGLIEYRSGRTNHSILCFENANLLYTEFPEQYVGEHLYMLRVLEDSLKNAQRPVSILRIRNQIESISGPK